MISVLIPSMYRPQLLTQTIQSFLLTVPNHELQFSLVIDEDYDSVEFAIGTIRYSANYVLDFSLQKRGALNAWNRALQISSGELVLIIGDDHKAHPGWYERAITAHRELGGYGVVGLNDLMHDGSLTTATTLMVDRKFIKEQFGGRVTYPCYHYYCQDSELNDRAKRVGKFIWLQDAVVEHIHAANNKRAHDLHDFERVENEYSIEDGKVYEERKAANFPDLWPSVI